MPSTSKKQARTMRAAAHDPSFAKKLGIPQTVAREYVRADSGKFHGNRDFGGRPVRKYKGV